MRKPRKLFRKIIKKFLISELSFGYSQFGEDLILSHFFNSIDITRPSYLDIGANEPVYISNTYFFYERGCKGICIEPNPFLANKFRKTRPRDTVINAGIGLSDSKEADFYLFPNYANGLSTFSEKEAKHWTEIGMKGMGKIPYEKVIKMPLININTILEQHFKNSAPDFISIDVEGLDYEIITSIDFTKFKPKVICAETLAYDDQQKGYKDNAVSDFLKTKGYSLLADTRVNSIMCLNELL
ncbi:hypothetical protein BH09BAC2_BH09BAC2_17080 [soil metagenome]